MAKLRGKEPHPQDKRLKLMIFGEAGVGKTTACLQMQKPYIIDCERGTDNYSAQIKAVGGVVFNTVDSDELLDEVRTLRTSKHDYLTLCIDSISTVYSDLLEKCEAKVGADFGRHYGLANKSMRTLMNLILSLDMNVVITAHSKPIYGTNLAVLGKTFDGWKNMDYMFDLVLELKRATPTERHATVIKTRIEGFPDGETFAWSLSSIAERYDLKEMERKPVPVKVATDDQKFEIKTLVTMMDNGEAFIRKCLTKADVDLVSDLSTEQADKIIQHLEKVTGGLHV
jgi:nucleoside-triphosphatase THEP1